MMPVLSFILTCLAYLSLYFNVGLLTSTLLAAFCFKTWSLSSLTVTL